MPYLKKPLKKNKDMCSININGVKSPRKKKSIIKIASVIFLLLKVTGSTVKGSGTSQFTISFFLLASLLLLPQKTRPGNSIPILTW